MEPLDLVGIKSVLQEKVNVSSRRVASLSICKPFYSILSIVTWDMLLLLKQIGLNFFQQVLISQKKNSLNYTMIS